MLQPLTPSPADAPTNAGAFLRATGLKPSVYAAPRLSDRPTVLPNHDAKWEANFEAVKQHKEYYGDFNVPGNYLKRWVDSQRTHYQDYIRRDRKDTSMLNEYRAMKLEEIGLVTTKA